MTVELFLKASISTLFPPITPAFLMRRASTRARHVESLNDLTSEEKADFAAILSQMRKKYDALFGFPMPLMMVLHQNVHFYVEFLPLQRSPTKLKYLATVESAFGTFLEDVTPEDAAAQLRGV